MNEYKKGSTEQLSLNFKSREFDCHGSGCCSTTKLDPRLVEYLQMIRDHFKQPINVTSAYRCETHNRNIGGASRSYHMQGKAADIVVQGVSSREVAKYAESIGILGIGLYETSSDGFFTHIDTRATKAFWYGQGQAYRSTFGGAPVTSANPEPPKEDEQETVDNGQLPTYHKSKNKYTLKLTYLQLGDRGRDVQIVQELLKNRGYELEASGVYDEATKKAVKDFQKKTNQAQDGIVGAVTMEKLLTV